MLVQCLGQEDPLEKEMAIHSGIFDWEIPWREESSRLPSMGRQESDMTATEHAHKAPFPAVGKFKAKAVGIKVIL